MKDKVTFILNGENVSHELEGERSLLWVLRADYGFTGTKYGCGEGFCGSCTVLVDNEAQRSCQLTLHDVAAVCACQRAEHRQGCIGLVGNPLQIRLRAPFQVELAA